MSTTKEIRKNLLQIEEEMNQKFINRREEIRGLIVALLARGNVVLLGPAGTAKTDLTQTLSRCINGDYFETLVSKTSSPEEFFGCVDIREFEQGRFVRNTTNTLATAQVGFIDEVFKCNGPTLNCLLPVLAQRLYRNGNSTPSPIPLQLFVGASNELPEGGPEGDLAPLWDRFELRYVTQYIKDSRQFIKLLRVSERPEPKQKISMTDIFDAQLDVKHVSHDKIESVLLQMWNDLKTEGLFISDRKWVNSLKYLQANAWLEDRTEIDQDDITMYSHILWNEPEQIKTIKKFVGKYCRPEVAMAQNKYDVACEMVSKLEQYTGDNGKDREKFGSTRTMYAAEVHNNLSSIKKALATTQQNLVAQGKSEDKETNRIIGEVNEMIIKVREILIG